MSVAVDSLKLIFCWHKLLSCTEVLVRPERSSKKELQRGKKTNYDRVFSLKIHYTIIPTHTQK